MKPPPEYIDSMPKPGPLPTTDAEPACEPPPLPFPIERLPSAFRTFVEEVSRANQVPLELPAVCCLAVASACMGSRLRVRSIHGKHTSSNIMVLVAADSGTGKGEVYRACIAPFLNCQEAAIKVWRDSIFPNAQAETRLLSKEISILERKPPQDSVGRDQVKRAIAAAEAKLTVTKAQMHAPCYLGSDFTTAALIRLLCRMEGQFFCASPDAKNFVDMVLGRYNDGSTDEEVYLKGFSLESVDRHRVSDEAQEIREACIVGLWLTQPDKLSRLLATRALSEGGLLPRLLILEVNCQPWMAYINEQGINEAARLHYNAAISALFQTFVSQGAIREIEATEDARLTLIGYHNAIAHRRKNDLRDVNGFAARWGEYAWRLSLVCHAMRLGGEAAHHPLTVEDAYAGVGIADWLARQQLEVLNADRVASRNARHEAVLQLFTATKTEVNARDVYRKCITPRGSAEMAEALLAEMETAGLLTHEDRLSKRKNHTERVYRRR